MSLYHRRTERRMLPRWKTSGDAAGSSDLFTTKVALAVDLNDDKHLSDVTHAFISAPSMGVAAELLAAATMAGRGDLVVDAASFVVSHEEQAPKSLLATSRALIFSRSSASEISNLAPTISRIGVTRQLLRLQHRNPVLWSDMARHYAGVGTRAAKTKAKHCMAVALSLAPNHRWMIRTAARFLVHVDQKEEAHRLVARHPLTPKDPWLIAAELATAQVAGRAPKFWRQAKNFLDVKGVAPIHLSELAAAMSMMEIESGEGKRARKLADAALRSPTENTLAQFSWARDERRFLSISALDDLVDHMSTAFEANYRLKYFSGDLFDARDAGIQWANDEPFAKGPLMELGFLDSILDDHQHALEWYQKAYRLQTKPDSHLELNMLFSRMSSGRLQPQLDAEEIAAIGARLRALSLDGSSYHAIANLALWEYRFGDPTIGAARYQEAIRILEKTHKLGSAALAAAYAAREAILAGQPNSLELLRRASTLSERSKSAVAEFYVRKMQALSTQKDRASDILSPKSANRFLPVR
jgi:tetratricopeptide (TPR) repeat protein